MATRRVRRREKRTATYVFIVIAGVIVGLIGGVALTISTTKTYLSSSTLFLSVPAHSAGELEDGSIFAQARVQSYIEVATSPEVLNAVIRTTGVSMSESALASEVTATAPPSKVLLMLSVQDSSASRAQTLCRALSAQVISAVDNLEAGGAGKSPVKLLVVSQAVLPTSPTAPQPVLYIGIAGLLGLVLGAVVAAALSRSSGRRDSVDAPVTES